MTAQFCTNCGARLKPLFQTLYCPSNCDRPKEATDWADEKTVEVCRKCGSTDLEPFPLMFGMATHCVACGAVW